jgi:hypothetical protein
MDQEQALREIDDQLESMLSGVRAPAHFASAVRARVQPYRVTKLPEILDLIGWAGVLAAMFVLAVRFVQLP